MSTNHESVLLGALITAWSEEAMHEVSSLLTAGPDEFSTMPHREVYQALLDLHQAGAPVNVMSVVDQLERTGRLKQAGGAAAVAEMSGDFPSSANAKYYAQQIHDRYIRQQITRSFRQILEQVDDPQYTPEELLEQVQTSLSGLHHSTIWQYQPSSALIGKMVEQVEWAFKHGEECTGVSSGFEELDRYTSGFQNAELIVIGARPSIGKTALALTMAMNAARDGKKVGFCSLEMAGIALMRRLTAILSKIPGDRLRNGLIGNNDFNRLTEAAQTVYGLPIYIFDQPNAPLAAVKAQARMMKRRDGIEILFVDYIGLVGSNLPQARRHEQISMISKGLKQLARELNIPVVVLAQLNRVSEDRSEPTLRDLKESGAIEEDADLVLLLHRERKTGSQYNGGSQLSTMAKLIVAKQRNGAIGDLQLQFVPSQTWFVTPQSYYQREAG